MTGAEPTRRGEDGAVAHAVLVGMLREEWRLHSSLFGGVRFAAFPAFVAVTVAVATRLLAMVDVASASVVAGLFALVFVFGLHTGTVGLVGRDAMGDLLGDLTLLVFTARTLPLSPRRLVAVFVAKDLLYYSVLFIVPLAIGMVPVVGDGPVIAGVASVLGLWLALTGTFVQGLLTTIAALGLTDRGVGGRVVAVTVAALLVAGWWAGLDVPAVTPYGAFVSPGPVSVGGSLALLASVFVVAVVTFDVTRTGGSATRTHDPLYGRIEGLIGDPVASKSLLDVHRSSGSVGKVAFSGAILFAVTAELLTFVGRVTAVAPSVAVSFGAILGFTGFTSYNWVTQFDDLDEYLVLPLGVGDVFDGTFRAFLVVGPPTTLVFYLLAVAWRGTGALTGVVGAVLAVGVTAYTGGLTMYLAGLSPNEFLFDTALFGLFWAGIALPVVPLLVVGFVLAPLSPALLAATGAWGALLGALGVGLLVAARGKWARYHRSP